MVQANFEYAAFANDAAGLPLTLSIFADRPHVRDEMRDDAQDAGLRVVESADIASLLDGDAHPLGEVVEIDCPDVDAAVLAALSRLDLRSAHCGAQLVVSTTIAALDDVFACLDRSRPQILVDPTRADRVIALGQVLARFPGRRLRELSEEDRLMLLRLTEQVGQIAQQVDRLGRRADIQGGLVGDFDLAEGDGAFRFEQPRRGFAGADDGADPGDRLVRKLRPPMPDPRMIRKILRQRQMRSTFFDAGLFADPAWDMLLDLTASRVEHTRVSITSLCIASGVPPTTALRWISQMTEAGLFQRIEDEVDRRRAFIGLSDSAADAMARYFAALGKSAAKLT